MHYELSSENVVLRSSMFEDIYICQTYHMSEKENIYRKFSSITFLLMTLLHCSSRLIHFVFMLTQAPEDDPRMRLSSERKVDDFVHRMVKVDMVTFHQDRRTS